MKLDRAWSNPRGVVGGAAKNAAGSAAGELRTSVMRKSKGHRKEIGPTV